MNMGFEEPFIVSGEFLYGCSHEGSIMCTRVSCLYVGNDNAYRPFRLPFPHLVVAIEYHVVDRFLL